MGNTVNPPKLVDLAKFWVDNGGVNLGIKGDAKHMHRGVSYHLGKGDLIDTAYSIQSKRDRKGLTKSASAIDLGKLDGTLPNLRAFSRWLVRRCQADSTVRRDIREIIYTEAGKSVQRYSGIDNKIHKGPGNGDASHINHTHISYFRDTEFNDRIEVFRPFFHAAWDPALSAAIQAIDPRKVALAMVRIDHDFGALINDTDLRKCLELINHPTGGSVDPGDVEALIKHQ
jgi:hypothetical protein